jgi:alpha-D-ribose 1-methylphosphonate 5-triphosphate synthase subunit PhnI
MAYVAVKGGEAAIDAAHAWRAEQAMGDPAIGPEQVARQLGRGVDRVMSEGGLYDPDLAATAILQAQGDLIEAAFLLRAYRTTLARFAASRPVDTARMAVRRRISATFKDIPGGQVLGPTADATPRLLDLHRTPPAPAAEAEPLGDMPRISDVLGREGLMQAGEAEAGPPGDITRAPLAFPAARDVRLQTLARGDEGFLLGLGYATQRGYGNTHPFVGELRMGEVAVVIEPAELGFAIDIGDVLLTECEMVNQFAGSATAPPQFTTGYGLAFGQQDRRAMSMALLDRALRAGELGEEATAPPQDAEFVLSHCDNVEATGFVEHLKLPHYVDFQAELEAVRRMRAAAGEP